MDQQRAFSIVESLYESWFGVLVRYGLRFTADRSLLEDAAQESMFLLYKALRKGSQIPNPKAWTMLVTKRLVFRQVRRQSREVELSTDFPAMASDPENLNLRDLEDSATVQEAALNLLSPREFEVLVLRLQAMKYREIAVILKVSPNTVNSLLARGLTKIRNWKRAKEQQDSPTVPDRRYRLT